MGKMVYNSMPKVVLTSTRSKNSSLGDINKAVTRAIDLLDFNLKRIEKVVIKPNLCYYWDFSTGETTDPRIVSTVIDYIRNQIGKDVDILIAEADASAMKTKYSFRVLGYDKLSQAKNVKLVNLSNGDIVNIKVKVREKEFVLPVNNVLLESDLIINVPKLKTHNITGMTCTLKNMFGAISKPRKYSYHNMLSHAIVGMNKIVRSHVSIVDGIVARGLHPKKLGVIIAGDDPLATDFKAAQIMGFNPRKIQHLNIANEEQIGRTNDIELIEDCVTLADIKNAFPQYNFTMHKFLWKLQSKLLKMYAAFVGDVVPPILEQ